MRTGQRGRRCLARTVVFVLLILAAGVLGNLGLAFAASSLSVPLPAGRQSAELTPGRYVPGLLATSRDRDVNLQRSVGFGLVDAPELARFLDEVLARLEQASPVRDVAARAYVRADDSWNALATASANVFVNVGLLRRLDSDGEVAALLSHELAHVILRHTDSDVFRQAQGRSLQLTRLTHKMKNGFRRSPAAGESVTEQERLLELNTTIVSPTWTRQQEQAADLLGVDLMVGAGFDPAGARDLLAKLVEIEAEQPTLSDVLADLERQLGAGLFQSPKSPGCLQNPTACLGKAKESAEVWVRGELGASHPRAVDRKEAVEEYIRREYGTTSPAATGDRWKQVRSLPANEEIFRNYEHASYVSEALQGRETELAVVRARKAVGGRTFDHAYPAHQLSLALEARGDRDGALSAMRAALAGREPAAAAYLRAATLHEKRNERDAAAGVLEAGSMRLGAPLAGLSRVGDAPAFFPDLIRLYAATDRGPDAQILEGHCATNYPEIADSCDAGPVRQQPTKPLVGKGALDLPIELPKSIPKLPW